jgi:hypothetical protein
MHGKNCLLHMVPPHFGRLFCPPGFGEFMGDSYAGYCAEAMVSRESTATSDTFIEEVPISIPNNSMYYFLSQQSCKIMGSVQM